MSGRKSIQYVDAFSHPDFEPIGQDRWAIQLIGERKALGGIQARHIEQAIAKVRNLWASPPGSGYARPEFDLDGLLGQFIAAGGALA